jgi:hypothetical protein
MLSSLSTDFFSFNAEVLIMLKKSVLILCRLLLHLSLLFLSENARLQGALNDFLPLPFVLSQSQVCNSHMTFLALWAYCIGDLNLLNVR